MRTLVYRNTTQTELSMHFKLVDPNYGSVFHALNIQTLNSDSRININRNPESHWAMAGKWYTYVGSLTHRERERECQRNRERDREGVRESGRARVSSIATSTAEDKNSSLNYLWAFFCVCCGFFSFIRGLWYHSPGTQHIIQYGIVHIHTDICTLRAFVCVCTYA